MRSPPALTRCRPRPPVLERLEDLVKVLSSAVAVFQDCSPSSEELLRRRRSRFPLARDVSLDELRTCDEIGGEDVIPDAVTPNDLSQDIEVDEHFHGVLHDILHGCTDAVDSVDYAVEKTESS
jgi:hypothetical protein